eukprot:4114798-Pleurochrysis_carterae.AAC.1
MDGHGQWARVSAVWNADGKASSLEPKPMTFATLKALPTLNQILAADHGMLRPIYNFWYFRGGLVFRWCTSRSSCASQAHLKSKQILSSVAYGLSHMRLLASIVTWTSRTLNRSRQSKRWTFCTLCACRYSAMRSSRPNGQVTPRAARRPLSAGLQRATLYAGPDLAS